MKGKLWKWWPIFLLCIIHTTKGSTEEKCLQDMEEVYPKKYFQYGGQSLPVNLDTSSRTTHQLSTHIFYIYVKEVLGYSKVEITHSEDHFQIESAIARLSDYVDHGRAKNDTIPPATINLEVWVSPDYDTFAKELVKECGSVGPPGRFGWFIPKNLSTPVKAYYRSADWTEDIQEVHWTLFMDHEMVRGFNIDKEDLGIIESKGYNKIQSEYICNDPNICKESMYTPKQCRNVTCAVLLAPEYNSTSFLINQINETNLLVKILWLGDNLQTVIETFEHRYRNSDKSLLFFYWYPSEIVLQEENYINVQFKNNEFYNFTHEKSVGYKYEMHRLVKLAWGKMALNAEPLYLGLRHFKLEDRDYDFLLGRYVTTNYTVRQIACDWMKANEHVWRNNWKVANEKQTIHIGGIFPMSATSYNGRGIAFGARLATTAINREKELLKGYNLNLIVTDGLCQPDTVMKNFIDFIVTPTYYKNLVGVLGPACSETVEPIAGVSKHYHVLIVSYSAEGASFSDRGKYPYFFRTIGENRHYKHVYLKLFERFGWRRVAALTEDGQKYTEYISLMSDDLEKSGVKFIANKKFPREKSGEDMKYYLADLKSLRARIIIADVVDNVARAVMCEAYKQEMTAAQGYVWFLPIWLDTKWYDTDYYNKQNENVSCSTEEMKQAIKGFFAMTHTYYAANSSLMQENITVGKWREKHEKSLNWSNYAGFAYDAVWTYAFALDKLSTTDPEAMSDLHSENTTNKLVRMVEATDFQGLSGHIKFRGGPSRFSNISIVQWYDDKFNTIGFFYPNLTEHNPEILGGLLDLSDTAIKWFTYDRKVPEDGTLPPPSCAVESLARVFDVECQTAVIILNVIVAGVLLIGVVGVCLYMKRKYDMKVQRTKNYMKALGFPFDPRNCSDLDRWETDRKAVFINRKIGEGAFGTVYGGDAEIRDVGYTAVAVKTLKVGSTAEEKLDFLSEAEAMKRFDHKNIVKLLGVCTKEEPVLAIMEFMLYGDLKCYLLARRHLVKSTKFTEAADEVSPKRLTNMALDVARGLSYLADLKFVHRDIASRNCLVNAQRTIKIGDFGMTRAMFDSDYYKFTRRGMLPVRWMSPESLALGVFTPASDVWSFGVLLYEIVTFGSIPFQGMSNSQVLDLVKEGHVLDIPKGLKPQLAGLIKSCWKQEAKERPTASQMVEFIANNPRLLTPCLDAPISSVQVGDSDQMEMSCRNFPKVSPRKSCNGRALQTQNFNFEDKHDPDNIPMEVCCPKEPLLGQGKSSSSNLLSRLVVGSRRESEDDDDPNRNVSDRQDNTNV